MEEPDPRGAGLYSELARLNVESENITMIESVDLAGLGVGLGFAAVSSGMARLNCPIESIVGSEFRFEMQIDAAVGHID
jgi:hypothetical protein